MFSKKPTANEVMRQQGQDLRRAQRDIDKTKRELERQEKTLEMEIKKAAKEGNKSVCALYAKQLVQLRKQKARCYNAGSQIGAIGAQTKVMQANSKVAGAMAATAKTMGKVNEALNPMQVMKSMQDFERENAKMSMKEEIMDDALSSALDQSDDEEEQDAIVTQVLDEIGIEINDKLMKAPAAATSALPGLVSTSKAKKLSDSDIEAQLAKLKM